MKCYQPNDPARRLLSAEEGSITQVILANGAAVLEKVPQDANADWYDIITVGTGEDFTEVVDDVARTCTRTWGPKTLTLEEAKAEKKSDFSIRRREAVANGIPVAAPQGTAILAYRNEADRELWNAWSEGLAAPPDGYRVNLLAPYGPNNKMQLTLMGAANINAGKQAIVNHIAAAFKAYDDGVDDTDAATTVTEVEAIDVESYPWPSNTVP